MSSNAKAELADSIVHWSNLRNNTAPSWWKDAGLRKCMINILLLYCAIIAYGYDGAYISTVQGLPPWQKFYGAPTGIKLGLIAASYLLPQLPFAYLGAWLGDRYGRKTIIFVASLIGVAGPMISGFGNSTATFCVGRVVTGISTSFYQVVAAPLIAEIAHPRFRAVVQGSTYCMFSIGAIIVGWIGFGCANWNSNWAWRVLTLMQFSGAIPLLIFSVTPIMVESPRWLVKQDRPDEALDVLAKLHANGDKDDELVQHELKEIINGVKFDAEMKASAITIKEWFITPGNRKRFYSLMLFGWTISMAGNNLVGYYWPVIIGTLGFHDPLKVQGLLVGKFVSLLFFGLAGAQLADRIGRRKLVLSSGLATAVSFTLFTALTATFVHRGGTAVAGAAVAFLYIFVDVYVFGFWPFTFLYLPEILPFHLRTQGMATYALAGNCGALYNSLVNPVALKALGWKYYLIFLIGNYVSVLLAYFLVVETKGLTLEEIAILFDGEKAGVIAGQEAEKAEINHEEDEKASTK